MVHNDDNGHQLRILRPIFNGVRGRGGLQGRQSRRRGYSHVGCQVHVVTGVGVGAVAKLLRLVHIQIGASEGAWWAAA